MKAKILLLFLCTLLVSAVPTVLDAPKIMGYAEKCLTHEGMLNRTDEGFVYVKVPDDYIFGTLKLLGDKTVEPPPYFGKGKVGAHISVIYAEESKGKQIILPQVGKTIEFTIVNFSKVKVENDNRIIYMFTVDAPELDRIRAINDLPPKLHGMEFHITVGVHPIRQRGNPAL